MATIAEDYVSFEVAKLLRDKRFDATCRYYYIQTGEMFEVDTRFHTCLTTQELLNLQIVGKKEERCVAPTLQMAMKWLREVHKKWITITFHWHTIDGETTLYYSPYIMLSEYENVVLEDKNPFKMKLFNSYEEACEAAIKYCLEHLI